MKILIIDNYDSFTYNIVHVVKAFGLKPIVFRNDKIEINTYKAVYLHILHTDRCLFIIYEFRKNK